MTTLTKTYTDNYYDSTAYRKTWTVVFNFADITVSGSTFQFVSPTVTAKFVGTSGLYRYTSVDGSFTIGGTSVVATGGGTEVLYRVPEYDSDLRPKGASNSTFTITKRLGTYYNSMAHTQTLNTASFFKSSNATSKSLSVVMNTGYFLSTNTEPNDAGNGAYYYPSSNVNLTIGTVTLNAPPTFTATTTSSGTYYAGVSTYTVSISSLSAKYGGTISSAVLTVGSQTASRTTNGTLSISLNTAGTFTPSVKVTDSRGQVTTTNLQPIVVNPYNAPAVNMNVFRVDGNSIRADEGHLCLIDASISYTSAIATLTAPTVKIDGIDISQLAGAGITWYTNWDNTSGVSGAISDWSALTPINDSVHIYGLIDWSYSTTGKFAEDKSYQITVQETDSLGTASTAISQTLSTAFYTIDFKAGGKEIAFGKPANDTLTQNQESVGLFKCGMEAQFKDAVVIERLVGEIKMWAGNTVPTGWLVCDGSAVSRTAYPLLFQAIGTLWGAGNGSTTFNLPNLKGKVPVGQNTSDTAFDVVGETGGAKTHLHTTGDFTLGTSHIPAHTHGSKTISFNFTSRRQGSNSVSHWGGTNTTVSAGSSGVTTNAVGTGNQTSDKVSMSQAHTHDSVGGGSAHNHGNTGNGSSLQPYAVVKYIICAV